jgi:peptidoglycan hydrolase-like amidase
MMKPAQYTLLSGIIIGTAWWGVNVSLSLMKSFSLEFPPLVYADEYDELQDEKQEKLEERQEIEEAVVETSEEKQTFTEQLNYYKGELVTTQTTITEKETVIQTIDQEKKQKEDSYQAKVIEKNSLVRDLYKHTDVTPLEIFLGSDSFSSFAQAWYYYRSLVGEGRRQILEVAYFLSQLEADLARETALREKLAYEASVLASQTVFFDSQIQEKEAYLSDLNSEMSALDDEIANITVRQEELIREKLSATSVFTTVGESEDGVQSLPDPGFSPAYAVYSYGYPHRVAMSQYGAYGRSKAGQDSEEILNSYYSGIDIVEYDVPEEISVTGNFNGEIDFEENYLKGIAEMPSSWGDKGGFEALKAQAIAARTYALSYTKDGSNSICDTQSCQVYLPSKAESDSAARWHEAVEETRGLVMVHDGSPIRAWYASTHGCYSRLPTDFDVKWNSTPPYIKRIKDADSAGRCYEGSEYAKSPWFHKSWYAASDGHPWLTADEMVDLLNASLLPNSYNDQLSHPDNGGWEHDEVLGALAEEGIANISNIKDITAIFSGEGYTNTLRVKHGGGSTDVDGQRFRKVFVLRSRGHLALWSSLFDVVIR